VRRSRIRGGHGVPVASAVVAGGSGGGSPAPRGVGSCRGRVGTQIIPAARSYPWCRSWRSHVRPSPPPGRRHSGWASPPPPPPPPATRSCHESEGGTSLHDSAGCREVVDATPSRRPEQVCQSVNLSVFEMHILFGCRFVLRREGGKGSCSRSTGVFSVG